MLKKIVVIVLFSLALFTRFYHLNYPKEAVFDEVHFFNYVKNYNLRKNFSLLHPPLGMLTIALMGKISRFDFKNNSISLIGDPYKDDIFWLRFIPALFGALLVPLVFLFIKKITNSLRAATLGSFFILFDNALLTQSRFILLDSQLVFFIIFSLYSFFSWLKAKEKNKKWIWLILTGLSAGAAASIKWTGLSALGVIGIYLFFDWLKKKNFTFDSFFSLVKTGLLILFLAQSVYVLSLTIHSQILKSDLPFLKKFIILNKEITNNLVGVTQRHPFESKWYQWIFGQKPIYYWVRGEAKIYLAGNPIIWLGSSLAIFLSFLYLITERKLLFSHQGFILLAYLLNLFPFIFIQRCTFLYHYFPALVLAIINFAILLDKYLSERKWLLILLVFMAGLTFSYLSPISYGIEITQERFENIFKILQPF